jgi:hypothetical protein
MRPFRLARIAAEAEGVRLRSMASRLATRIVFFVVALLFVIGAVVFVHIGAWYWIRIDGGMSFYATSAILGGTDLLIAVILVALASRSGPSRVEREALEVRRRAVQGITSAVTLSQVAIPTLRAVAGMRQRRRRA